VSGSLFPEARRKVRAASSVLPGTRKSGVCVFGTRRYPVIAAGRTNVPPGVLRQDFPPPWQTKGVSLALSLSTLSSFHARFPDRISGRFERAERNRSRRANGGPFEKRRRGSGSAFRSRERIKVARGDAHKASALTNRD